MAKILVLIFVLLEQISAKQGGKWSVEQPWAVAETGGWWVAMWLPFLDCEKCRTLPEPKFPLRENNGRGVRGVLI